MSSPSSSSTSPSAKQDAATRQFRVAAVLFVATFCCVFWVYGTQWAVGDLWSDRSVISDSLAFAGCLMAIFLAHEMGHYVFARLHRMDVSPPFFLPVPFGFGTFGAIIRVRSPPRDRTALMEMGAAGPIAGFVVALGVLWVGLHDVHEAEALVVTVGGAAEAVDPSDWSVRASCLLAKVLAPLDAALCWVSPELCAPGLPVQILANPPVMDLVGTLVNGAPPSRYATLGPVALAGWVGCLLTAINLLPIGQLDGGHVFNALWPRAAPRFSRVGVGLVLAAGVIGWGGWIFWGVLLIVLGAWRSMPIPSQPGLRPSGVVFALLALLCFGLSFMPRPFELEVVPWSDVRLEDADGNPVDVEAFRAQAPADVCAPVADD